MKNSKIALKILSLLMAAVMLLGFSACADTSYVAKSGDNTISAGVYIGLMLNSYYTAASSVEDTSKDLFSQKIDGVSADKYIKDLTEAACKEYIAIDRLFNEYELSFTDEEMATFNKSIDSIWTNIEASYLENGCGKKSFSDISLMEEKKTKIFEYYYSENGKEPVSEAVLKKEFKENCTKIKYVDITYKAHYDISTSADATEQQKTDLKALAEKYVERLKNGEKIDDLANEQTALAEGSTEVKPSEEIDFTFIQRDTSEAADQINKDIFNAKIGEPTVITNSTSGYYVIVRYEVDENGDDFKDNKSSLLSNLKSEDFNEIMVKAAKEVKITMNAAAVKRFKPQNITVA